MSITNITRYETENCSESRTRRDALGIIAKGIPKENQTKSPPASAGHSPKRLQRRFSSSRSGRIVTLALLFLLLFQTFTQLSFELTQNDSYSLSLLVAPPSIPADGKKYDAIYVQVQKAGQPVLAPSDIRILISSSNAYVGTVDQEIILRKGDPYAAARFETTLNPGITNITASANNFDSATVQLSTVRPSGTPSKMRIRLSPEVIPAEEGTSGQVLVELQDHYGSPSPVNAGFRIQLSSSNPSVVTVDRELAIPAGSFFGIAHYYATYLPGSAVITASSSELDTAVATAKTSGQTAVNLTVLTVPNRLPVGVGQTGYVMVQMRDSSGQPVRASADTTVFLSSSNPSVARTQEIVTINRGSTFAVGKLTTGSVNGSTTVSASAAGFTPASSGFDIVAESRSPKSLKIHLSPKDDVADPNTSPLAVVQLLDENGLPALARGNVTVSILSSNLNVANIERSTIIGLNASYGVAHISPTFRSGLTTLTASAQSFEIAKAVFKTQAPIPARLNVSIGNADLRIPAIQETYEGLVVQLRDAAGNPAKAPSDMVVLAASSNPQIVSTPSSITIKQGSTTTQLPVDVTERPGSATIRLSAEGLPDFSLSLTTVEPHPSRLVVYPILSRLPASGKFSLPVIVQLQDSSKNPAVASTNIIVAVSSSNSTVGFVSSLMTILSRESVGTTYFQPTGEEGSATITAQASGYSSGRASIKTLSETVPAKPTPPPPSSEPASKAPLNQTRNSNATTAANGGAAPMPAFFNLFGIAVTQDLLMLVIPAIATPILGVMLVIKLRERSKKSGGSRFSPANRSRS